VDSLQVASIYQRQELLAQNLAKYMHYIIPKLMIHDEMFLHLGKKNKVLYPYLGYNAPKHTRGAHHVYVDEYDDTDWIWVSATHDFTIGVSDPTEYNLYIPAPGSPRRVFVPFVAEYWHSFNPAKPVIKNGDTNIYVKAVLDEAKIPSLMVDYHGMSGTYDDGTGSLIVPVDISFVVGTEQLAFYRNVALGLGFAITVVPQEALFNYMYTDVIVDDGLIDNLRLVNMPEVGNAAVLLMRVYLEFENYNIRFDPALHIPPVSGTGEVLDLLPGHVYPAPPGRFLLEVVGEVDFDRFIPSGNARHADTILAHSYATKSQVNSLVGSITTALSDPDNRRMFANGFLKGRGVPQSGGGDVISSFVGGVNDILDSWGWLVGYAVLALDAVQPGLGTAAAQVFGVIKDGFDLADRALGEEDIVKYFESDSYETATTEDIIKHGFATSCVVASFIDRAIHSSDTIVTDQATMMLSTFNTDRYGDIDIDMIFDETVHIPSKEFYAHWTYFILPVAHNDSGVGADTSTWDSVLPVLDLNRLEYLSALVVIFLPYCDNGDLIREVVVVKGTANPDVLRDRIKGGFDYSVTIYEETYSTDTQEWSKVDLELPIRPVLQGTVNIPREDMKSFADEFVAQARTHRINPSFSHLDPRVVSPLLELTRFCENGQVPVWMDQLAAIRSVIQNHEDLDGYSEYFGNLFD
jgi:hypothetical protein